jgi:Leu/Phe-tRNA-protein transferase
MIFMGPEDDCEAIVDIMLASGYSEEFCVGVNWDPLFIARLMKAGFLVMSDTINVEDDEGNPVLADIVLPKLHLVRSALFFGNLHIKRSIKPYLSRYELRFNTDFRTVVQQCLEIHGQGWLTPSLVQSLFAIREGRGVDGQSGAHVQHSAGARHYAHVPPPHSRPSRLVPSVEPMPVSFGLYRDGVLQAGEFGVICGRVYTSYSGFKTENNAGTVQMILMARALEAAGFDFLDFGMPLPYKTDLGALDISPGQFTGLFRAARNWAAV